MLAYDDYYDQVNVSQQRLRFFLISGCIVVFVVFVPFVGLVLSQRQDEDGRQNSNGAQLQARPPAHTNTLAYTRPGRHEEDDSPPIAPPPTKPGRHEDDASLIGGQQPIKPSPHVSQLNQPKKQSTVPILPPPSQPLEPKREKSPSESQQELEVADLIQRVKKGMPARRIKAANELGKKGLVAKAASRALCECLLDDSREVRESARDALEKVNPRLYNPVITLLVDKDPHNSFAAVAEIRRLGSEGSAAVPVLLRAAQVLQNWKRLNGGRSVVQGREAEVFVTLAEIAPQDEHLSQHFVYLLLKDPEPGTRMAVAKAFPRLQAGKKYVLQLCEALGSDPIDGVRAAAAIALGDLGQGSRQAVKGLRRAMADPSLDVREAVEHALEKLRRAE